MAFDCSSLRDEFARQTPVYDKVFLNDYISDMFAAPFLGRHQTGTWEDGAAVVRFDKVHVAQPNFLHSWGSRADDLTVDAYGSTDADCVTACNPPRNFINMGTTRDSFFMEHQVLNSQHFCLDELRKIPHLDQHMQKIFRVLRKMPTAFVDYFIRTRMTSYHDTLYIAGSDFDTVTLSLGVNIDANCQWIELGGAGNIPTSQLTLPILQVYSDQIGRNGYDEDSGLPAGMRNLVTHPRVFQKLVGLNPEVRSLLALQSIKDASPLYMPGKGINAEPFGAFAPTFDDNQLRFQHVPGTASRFQQVLPKINIAATTGVRQIDNPAYRTARYGISYLLHPYGARVYTPKPSKVHDMVPTVNSAMWGTWKFHNPEGTITIPMPDGTTCTMNNDLQWLFYWICYLECGFKYEQRPLVFPIFHLLDQGGQACVVDDPVCGDEPQYAYQYPSSDPQLCEAD